MLNFSRIIFFCLLALFFNVKAQTSERDSLWKIYVNKSQNDTLRLNALESILKSFLDVNPDSVMALGERQILLAQETKQEKYAANAYSYIGYSYYMHEKTTKALEYFLRALAIYQSLDATAKISKCYTFIGLNYFKQSNYPQTLDYYFKSLKIEEKAGNKKGMGMCYNNIGLVYDRQSDYPKSLEYYSKALTIYKQLNQKIGIANSLFNSGNVYEKQHQKEKALSNFQEALKIYEEEQSELDISFCLISIGIIYFDQSNYSTALEYYNKALKIDEKLENKKEMATCLYNIAILYNQVNEYKLAELNFNKAMALSLETNDPDVLRLCYEGLSKVYKNTGDYKNAYENHVKFKQLTDSIFNEENSKQLGDIKTNFEVGKIETELKAKAEAREMISSEERKRQRFIIYGIVVILIVALFFSFFLYKRYRLTNQQKKIIELKSKETEAQKTIIEEHQKETIDSINYAKRIQLALLANEELIGKHFPKHFVVFSPKDIVSGDFYWAAEHNNKFYLAVCDSTGHGVPGAFMSLLNIGFLNEAIKEKDISQPHEVLNFVRRRLIETIGNDGQQDGMDGILICVNNASETISYSAANNAPLLIRNKEVIELPKDKMPVGKGEKTESFSQHSIEVQLGDSLYLYTDGYGDQFGGPKGKKFKNTQLLETLSICSELSLEDQKEIISEKFNNWKGELEQVDDVCLIGIKI